MVPHQKGQNIWVKIPIFFLILLFLFFFLGTVFFLTNIRDFFNTSSIAFLEIDNQKLKEKINIFKEKVEIFEDKIDSLLEEQNKVLEEHHILKNDKKDSLYFSPESLFVVSKWIDSIFISATKKYYSILSSVPSIMPVKGYIITKFGKRVDPFTGLVKTHPGIRILAPINTPVVSSGDGVVRDVGNTKGKGIFVEIEHPSGFVSSYSHLLRATVREGEKVKRGTVIGYIGQTGRAPYPYLFYEIRKGSTFIDPEKIMMGGY